MKKWIKSLIEKLFSREEAEEEIKYSHCPLCGYRGDAELIKKHLKFFHNL